MKVDLEQNNIEKSIHEDRKKELEHQIENLKYKHQEELDTSEFRNNKLETIAKKLNAEIYEIKENFTKEKSEIVKNFRTQVKDLKRSLGVETTERIKMEKKLKEANEINIENVIEHLDDNQNETSVENFLL